MRWDNLFDDLEGQLEQELSAEQLDLHAEEERLRLGRLSLRDRIAAACRGETQDAVRLLLVDGTALSVRPRTLGRDWFSAAIDSGFPERPQCIIPIPAIVSVAFTREQLPRSLEASTDESSLPARLSLSFVLRDICRRRARVVAHTLHGVHHGTIDRVARDHLDLAEHDSDQARRDAAVARCRTIAMSHIVLLRLPA